MDGLAQASSSPISTGLMRIMGVSVFASLFQQIATGFHNGGVTGGGGGNYVFDTARIFILGALIEGGRRFFQWLIERVRFRESNLRSASNAATYRDDIEYSITATFTEGDPAYEWVVLFLVSSYLSCMRPSSMWILIKRF
jgi:mitochondrial chaperone BCS1